MQSRLVDYALVALVIVVIVGLFRLSRYLLNTLLDRISERDGGLTADRVLRLGLRVLLVGLLGLPFVTSLLAFADPLRLPGGMPLHLAMVAVSVVLFSIAEDSFRIFRGYPRDERWTVGRHMAAAAPFLVGFWLVGCLFLSPLFYSGLTVIIALFYLFALSCRPGPSETGMEEDPAD